MQHRLAVDEQTIKRNIDLNLKRLKRQYDISVNEYDEVSLLELSHALRMWVDMQDHVQSYLTQHLSEKQFRVYTLRPELEKACCGSKYLVTYFVGGLTTYSTDKPLVSFRGIGQGPSVMSFGMRPPSAGGAWINYVLLLAEYKIKYEYEPETAFLTSDASFKKWLESEVVRVCFTDEVGEREERLISRIMLIKRVANNLGGSHPAGVFDVVHKYDKAVDFLLGYEVGGLPLPYYILLKSAYDILTGFDYL
ncbi:hypothetical protein [Hymenobacter sp. HDW8]|uniref:hypothetical protein n=1 Tax=Hymenobacter sp. HDW8 TaxID=2714932 RepID=UPI00140E9106|nr:hypothetical protein [Hymenobacter sp. HDW8]QIL78377.1 hypothetical protein G7064_21415 [Hymenobacter sp. HDW8]